jgi:hypothetical protein
MYQAPRFETPTADAYLKQYDNRKEQERLAQQRGQSLGEIGQMKYNIDTAPEGTDVSGMNQEMYGKMGEAGYGDEAMAQMFPKSQNNSLAQKQGLMSEMGRIDSEMALIGRQYHNALKSGNQGLADSLYNKANELRAEFSKYAFGTSQSPKSWAMFKQKPIDTDNLGASGSSQIVLDAYKQLEAGEITQDEFDLIKSQEQINALSYGKEIVDVQGDILEGKNKQAEETRKQQAHGLKLNDAENKLFQQGVNNLQKFKVMTSLDAYNKYEPTLDSEYESAKSGKAGSQRAIVVAFNKLIEPSSAVMEGDFRSSGNNAIASATQQLGDGAQAVLSGDYDALGRKLSSAEITAIYQAGKRIAQGLRGSISLRLKREEELLQNNMDKYGFEYQPNAFQKYIALDKPKSAKLNPADYNNLGAFRRAGGSRQEWFKNKGK